MDECREAFEKLPEIKDSLSENIVFVGNKYTSANEGFYDLVNWLNGGWYMWQSRQAEVDELNQLYLKAQHQVIRHRTIAQDALALVEEKDKRVEELESHIKGQIETLKCASKSWVYTEREQNIMLSQADDLEKALRGEHE